MTYTITATHDDGTRETYAATYATREDAEEVVDMRVMDWERSRQSGQCPAYEIDEVVA